jgi:hypothetical protein
LVRLRGALDDDVLGHDRRAVPGDFAVDGIEILIGVLLQIDHAAVAEVGKRMPGARIEADELIADGHVEDALVASTIGPVAHATSRQAPR